METNKLSNVFNPDTRNIRRSDTTTHTSNNLYFYTYLRTFTQIVGDRFPVCDLERIDLTDVETIADFSAAISRVALDRWEEISTRRKAA